MLSTALSESVESLNRLVVVGNSEIFRVVEPIADNLGLRPTYSTRAAHAIGNLYLNRANVAAAVIDTVHYRYNARDPRLNMLIHSLQIIQGPPIPTALIAVSGDLEYLAGKYNFGTDSEDWAALQWPTNEAIVKHWLKSTIKSRRGD